jgi:phosphatidylserine decarboxylase
VAERAAQALHIAREGLPLTLGVGVAAVILIVADLFWIGLPVLLVSVAIASFFRDPNREPPTTAQEIFLSAADGKVCDIAHAPIPGGDGAPRHRVAVFMSPLNVHVNRAPIAGQVIRVHHTSGEFRAAFRDTASEKNERNLIEIADSKGRRHAIVQIAGYLARRIVCRVCPADAIERGQRVGLIMFGSRVDHYFPLDYRVNVKLGDRVRAGLSVLGEASGGD